MSLTLMLPSQSSLFFEAAVHVHYPVITGGRDVVRPVDTRCLHVMVSKTLGKLTGMMHAE